MHVFSFAIAGKLLLLLFEFVLLVRANKQERPFFHLSANLSSKPAQAGFVPCLCHLPNRITKISSSCQLFLAPQAIKKAHQQRVVCSETLTVLSVGPSLPIPLLLGSFTRQTCV